MCALFHFFFTSHAFFVNLDTDLFILCFIYIILSFIIKDMYVALSEFSVYINSDFKHDVYEYYIYDVINLSDDYKHAVNQYYNCYA